MIQRSKILRVSSRIHPAIVVEGTLSRLKHRQPQRTHRTISTTRSEPSHLLKTEETVGCRLLKRAVDPLELAVELALGFLDHGLARLHKPAHRSSVRSAHDFRQFNKL